MPELSEYKDDWMEDADDEVVLAASDGIMKQNAEAQKYCKDKTEQIKTRTLILYIL